MDLAPGVSTPESLAQLLTGRSSLTGQEKSRLWGAIGLILFASVLKQAREPSLAGSKSIARGLPENVATHAAYKDGMRAAMEGPSLPTKS
jgi:filamentous hemagglutinin